MKRLLGLIFISLILISVTGCKKEAVDIEQNKAFLSSGQWIPGELYYDEDFYYWIDPDMWNEPVDPSEPIKGDANMKGYLETYIIFVGGREIIQTKIVCFDNGTRCGNLYWPIEGGGLYHFGYYLVKE